MTGRCCLVNDILLLKLVGDEFLRNLNFAINFIQ